MSEESKANVYGYCPYCGEPGVSRERRPNGDDKCASGHTYPSSKAVRENPDAARHTPEPWRISGAGDNMMIIQTSHVTRDVWTIPRVPEDMHRIVACVNACTGLADPAKDIAALRDALCSIRDNHQ